MEESQIGPYKILTELGRGSFGIVYEVLNTNNNKKYAMKIEEPQIEITQLDNEYAVYNELEGIVGIPKIYFFGKYLKYKYIIIQQLGPSLGTLQNDRKKLTLKTCCMVMKRLINIIESIHQHNYIYRDMKPENIVIYEHNIYLIDFGMCKKYVVKDEHIPMKTNKVLTGTARYASINTHLGYEQSRRDDLEGIFYVVVYLAVGYLPWMGIPAPTRLEKYAKIGQKKKEIKPEILCEKINGAKFFVKIIKYIKSLEFMDKPDYDYIRDQINKVMSHNTIVDDGMFDWIEKDEVKSVNGDHDSSVEEVDKPNGKDESPWNNFKAFFK